MSSPSLLRTAHGTGESALLRTERPPVDELTPLRAEDTEAGLAVRKARGRPFTRGNAAPKGKTATLATVTSKELGKGDPRWRNALRQANTYRQRRVRELAIQHGGTLGAGPCAMLANAAHAMAASRVLYELAAETLDADLFKKAASLADSARQQELTAVALAEREAAANVETDEERVRRERLETMRRTVDSPPPPGRADRVGD